MGRPALTAPDHPGADELRFDPDGAERFRGALGPSLAALRRAVAGLPEDRAGLRITGLAALRRFLAPEGPIGAIAAGAIGPAGRAVRAVLFDKTAATNWALAWHQDRTIPVARRVEVAGFGPWTVKGGLPHVAPPAALLGRMVTLRAHLDDVPATNAPLLVAPGSHRCGRVPVAEVAAVVGRHGVRACLAGAGDVWLYATPILHASEAAAVPARRRVLQVDYAAEDLPGGLEWLGV